MLFPEEKKVYETKIKGTKFIVTSESLPDTRQNIFDSLSRLMVRDCGEVYDPKARHLPKKPTREEIECFKGAMERANAPIEWDIEKDVE